MNFKQFFNFQLIKEAKDLEGYYAHWPKRGIIFPRDKELDDAYKIVQRAGKYEQFLNSYQQPTFYETHPQEYKEDLIDFAKKISELKIVEYELKTFNKRIKEAAVENVIYENDKFWILAPENYLSSVKCARYKSDSKDWIEYKSYYQSEDEHNFLSHELVDPTWCVAYPDMSSYWFQYGCDGETYSVFYVCSKKSYNHRWAIVMESFDGNENIIKITPSNLFDYIQEVRDPLQKHSDFNKNWDDLLNYFKVNPKEITDVINEYYYKEKEIGEISISIFKPLLYILNNFNIAKSLCKELSFNTVINKIIFNNDEDYDIYQFFYDSFKNGNIDIILKFANTKLKEKVYPVVIPLICLLESREFDWFVELNEKLKNIPIITNNMELPIQKTIFNHIKNIEDNLYDRGQVFNELVKNKKFDFTSIDQIADEEVSYGFCWSKKFLSEYNFKEDIAVYFIRFLLLFIEKNFAQEYENIFKDFLIRQLKNINEFKTLEEFVLYNIITRDRYSIKYICELIKDKNKVNAFFQILPSKQKSLEEIVNYCNKISQHQKYDESEIINKLKSYELLEFFNFDDYKNKLLISKDLFYSIKDFVDLGQMNLEKYNKLTLKTKYYINNEVHKDVEIVSNIILHNRKPIDNLMWVDKKYFDKFILEPLQLELCNIYDFEEKYRKYNIDLDKLDETIDLLNTIQAKFIY